MDIEFIPSLHIQRELYEQPRDMARFRWYVAQMTGTNEDGETDVVMPITSLNPMGREHCLAGVHKLISIDADTVAAQAAQMAAARLGAVDGCARVFVNFVDDVMGGWTNRYFVEAKVRYGDPHSQRANEKRNFAGVFCWASEIETYTPQRIHQETLSAVFRFAHFRAHGVPRTLAAMLQLDGQAAAFADIHEPTLPADELAYTREVLAPLRQSTEFPVQFAALFGDEAANSVGYPPLGLPNNAGIALAIYDGAGLTA